MAGVAGAVIGLASGAQASIAGAKALTDATTSGRGCTTNFIGFGLDATSAIQKAGIEDFNATDDSVTLGITAGAVYAPDYTTTPGPLEWLDTTP